MLKVSKYLEINTPICYILSENCEILIFTIICGTFFANKIIDLALKQ